jgi:hypothetical protein
MIDPSNPILLNLSNFTHTGNKIDAPPAPIIMNLINEQQVCEQHS